MLTPLQIRGAQAIVVVFETGDPRGDYGAVTVIPWEGQGGLDVAGLTGRPGTRRHESLRRPSG